MASEQYFTSISLWDKKLLTPLLEGIRLSKNSLGNFELHSRDFGENETCGTSADDNNKNFALDSLADLAIATKMACSVCNATFTSRQKQVHHFKLDWHCENLKRREQGLQPITETDFQNSLCGKTSQESDTIESSSSSSSSSETEEEEWENPAKSSNKSAQRLAKIYFENQSGETFFIHKCLVMSKREEPPNEAEVVERIRCLASQETWAVFLLGGGHFAAGVFKREIAILHKTFHRYITRAKQGTSQSVHDQHNKHAKSAGANLRRHNELALAEDIKTLLQSWSEQLDSCSLIFYRASGHNKRALFGKRKPLFLKEDPRLRNIPFPTKRASFQEGTRVHAKLSTIYQYGPLSEREALPTSPSRSERRSPSKSHSVQLRTNKALNEETRVVMSENNDKHTRTVTVNLLELAQEKEKDNLAEESVDCITGNNVLGTTSERTAVKKSKRKSPESRRKARQVTPAQSQSTSCDNSEDSIVLEFQDQLMDTSDLRTYEVAIFEEYTNTTVIQSGITPITRKSGLSDIFSKEERELRNSLYTACKVNDTCTVQKLLSPLEKISATTLPQDFIQLADPTSDNTLSPEAVLKVLNSPFGDTKMSLLHVLSQSGFSELLWFLLESGADPSVRDNKGRPPYILAVNKDTRNTFRRFMFAYPGKYNYATAQIPSPLSDEAEKARLMKQQQHRQQKRQKAKAVKAEEEEKAKFLSLADSEKKVVMADQTTTLRCILCGNALKDQVPFEYSNLKFCTIKCLQQHRKLPK